MIYRRTLVITIIFVLCCCLGSVATVKTWALNVQSESKIQANLGLEHHAHMAYDNGNYTGALFYAKQALQLKPNDVQLLTNLGSIEEELGNFSGALSYYKRALSEDPKHVGALIGVALSLEDLGNHTEAMRYYKQAIAQPPNQQRHNNVNLIQRADAFIHLGNYSHANTIINQVLKKSPMDVDALETAGVIMLCEKNATRALVVFNKLLATHPNLQAAIDNKGIALAQLGDKEQALTLFHRSIALNPNDVYAYYNEGLMLQKMRNFTGAILAYNQALKLTPPQ
jgi:tetratricopeptide (TPR) repeat protein